MTVTEKSIKKAPNRRQIKALYINAFPKEERLPWWVLRLGDALGRLDVTAYYAGTDFCGFTVSAATEDIYYIMFFAVEERHRGQGYGSEILRYIQKNNPGKTVLLNVEIPDSTAPNNDQRLRRMAFYRRNGFRDTGYNIREVGGIFRVLGNGSMDPDGYRRVFMQITCGLWKPPITKISEEVQE